MHLRIAFPFGALGCVFLLAPFAAAQDSRPSRIAQEIAAQQLVSISIAWIEDGQVTRTESFGFEDREQKIPASGKTMYRWASISKPVTAIVGMQLVEQEKLDLDRDVCEYVPEFPRKAWPITCRQLLSHQGGIVHYTNGKVIPRERKYEQKHPWADPVLALDAFADSPLICEPGTKHSYTTHGYMLLGAVVQRAGGKGFWEQVQERVAKPLQMSSFQPDYPWVAIPHRAVGYRKANGKEPARSGDTDVSWKLPGGGFISTIGDLGRFGAGLLRGELVTVRTRELMWTRATTRDGKVTGYGLGFGVREGEVSHSGGQEKTSTLLVLQPGKKRGIALMSNSEGSNLSALAHDLLR